jgi:hypothetical protein
VASPRILPSDAPPGVSPARALGLVVVGLASACALVAPAPTARSDTRFTVLVTSQLQGSVEPCGCSASMRGGLSRVASVVAQARQPGRPVFFLDVGDGLFPALDIPEAALAQQERKARTIAQALTSMGVAARAPGPLDDARGQGFRRSLGLPELAVGDLRVLDDPARRLAAVRAGSLGVARTLGRQARASGAVFVVAVVDLPFEALVGEVDQALELDLVLAARLPTPLQGEQNRLVGTERVKLVQVQSKGRSVLEVDLTLRDSGRGTWFGGSAEQARELAQLDERIELLRTRVNGAEPDGALRAVLQEKLQELLARRAVLAAAPVLAPASGNAATLRFVPVESTVPKEPAVAEVERAYNQEVGDLNLAWARAHGRDCAAPTQTAPGFVGSASCRQCHPQAVKVWQATRHAQAHGALRRVGKQYHLDCIGCHVTGWQQPGGVCRVDRTEGREAVTCESCHGPGSVHLATPVRGNISLGRAPEACVGCHDHENSPAFEATSYVARILGPGHGVDAGTP